MLGFYLDKSKLTEQSDGSNFIVLHQLLYGSSLEEKRLWQLNPNKDAYVLLKDRPYAYSGEDNNAFQNLRHDLKLMGKFKHS